MKIKAEQYVIYANNCLLTKDFITKHHSIIKIIGMTTIAEETGLSRPSLFKALLNGAKPQFDSIMKVLKAKVGKYK
jgi:probable addiction module antidote protein